MPLVHFKTGLLAGPSPELHFRDYMLPATLPKVPPIFGHQNLYMPRDWGMLGNDRIGDCAVAGAMHCEKIWNKVVCRDVTFTTDDAISDYSALTGYVRGDASTDQGTTIAALSDYWKKIGFRDFNDNRHKIEAYVALDPTNLEHLFAAAYWFDGGVGIAVQIPSSAEAQFLAHQPWSNVHGDKIEGYHFVPLIARLANGNAGVITWGGFQEVELSWLAQNCNQASAFLSIEDMTNGKSPEGFDLNALQEDLETLAIS